MEIEQIYIYLFVMSAVTIAIRLVPLTLIRGQVHNQFIRSFLYYVPYVTLAVMTFPAILSATQTPISGALAFAAGIALAWYGASLFKVSAACCVIVFVVELGLC
ncbi:MAG: AzlD domain-containing protein [Veillonellaceae bacterium]|nr:AzlD domain-containing protein [Veillonellaceae bacterium]